MQVKFSVGRVQCSVDADTTSRNSADVEVSNRRVVPLGDRPRHESSERQERGRMARHLAPVELRGGMSMTGPCVHKQGAGCSNKGFLPISTAYYLILLDWTARQTRSGKQGSTPKQFAPLFDRLGITPEIWSRLVVRFWQAVQRGRRSASANRRASLEGQFASLPHSPGNPRVAGNGLAGPTSRPSIASGSAAAAAARVRHDSPS